MRDLAPTEILKIVASELPEEIRGSITIVGSVAAGSSEGPGAAGTVRTKDVDCICSPLATALANGPEMVKELLRQGWTPKDDTRFPKPWDSSRTDDQLPVLRLFPPHSRDWFLEFLSVPEPGIDRKTKFERFVIDPQNHFVLPCFAFSPIAIYDAKVTESGLKIARPEMMALAHLLEHPAIGNETIQNTKDKRSNKDLGRAIALARLHDDELDGWPQRWLDALQHCFKDDWSIISSDVGNGIEELLGSDDDLNQAYDICIRGLLANRQVTLEQFRVSGRRLHQDVVKHFLDLCKRATP